MQLQSSGLAQPQATADHREQAGAISCLNSQGSSWPSLKSVNPLFTAQLPAHVDAHVQQDAYAHTCIPLVKANKQVHAHTQHTRSKSELHTLYAGTYDCNPLFHYYYY